MKKFYLNLVAVVISFVFAFVVLPSCNHKNENEYEQEDEHDEYDKPGAAAEFEFNRNIDPATGTVPHERMWQAVLETENQKNTNNLTSAAANAPLAWVERGSNSDVAGPQGNQRPGNGVTSGRMKAVWVDIADPTGNTVWVGGVWGGLWKTTDITASVPNWNLVNDYLSNLVVTGICQDPTNPNTMYMATGESGLLASYSIVGIIRGDGVFKSTDHGITWAQLPSSTALTNCTKILCDASGNLYVSSVGIGITGNPNTGVLGLLRSSDGGTTFTNINPFTSPSANATSRVVDFEISSLGVMHVVGGLNSGAGIGGYRYTAAPSTATTTSGWNTPTTNYTIPTGAGARVEITTSGNTIYAAISNASKIDNIAKSIDGGNNWITTPLTAANITALNGGSGQGSYSNTIGIDPSDPNTVIVGSLNLLKSIDGSTSFFKISEWVGTVGQYCHADHHSITWYNNGNKLLVGTDGGLFYSTNKGVNISDKNTGLRLKQFYGVAMHPTLPNYFLAGAQDNGTHQFNNPGLSSSIEVLGGDGGITGIDQDEPQFQAATYVYANFRRSGNGGASWSSNGSNSTDGLFINPYDYDNAANKIYAGNVAGQFYRWENPHVGFTLTSVPMSDFGTGFVSSVTSSSLTANRVYFGLTNGRIIKVDNADAATPTSTILTPTAMPAAAYVTCVAEASVNTQNLLATVANYGVTNIYATIDGGTTWAACDGNLPDMPVYWAVYHPDSDTKAYIATETGVWSTDLLNGASTVWTAETTFPTVKTSMLKYRASDRTIAAATYGRGLWTAIIPNTSCQPASITTQPTGTAICEGSNTSFSIVAGGSVPLGYQWQLSTAGAGGPWNNITNNTTYTNSTTATLSITGATVSLSSNQYRCVVTGNCAPLTANSNPALLTVNPAPAAPTATTPVTYCQNATATALTATGTNLLWYTSATGGTGSTTAPIPSTTTSGSTIYYVTQTINTCEGQRKAITVNVNATPAAPFIVNTTTSYCQGSTASVLTPIFSGPGPDPSITINFYTVASGGVALSGAPTPSTAAVGSTTYYVSLTNGTCEGPRTAMTVTITAVPAAPTVTTPIQYCQGVTAVALTATGSNLLWYANATGGVGGATAPTPNTTTVGSTTFYVSQTTGCESPRAAIVVNIVAGTAAPTVNTPVAYCQNATATALLATGSNLMWYATATGGTGSNTATIPSTTTAGSITYYVSQTSGSCESPRAAIQVNVTATPLAPIVTTPVNYCQNATATPLTATGTNLKWYLTALGGVGSATAPTPSTTTIGNTNYYVSQSNGTCEGPRATILVTISAVSPAPTVTTPVVYCQNATTTALTATGTNLLWYPTASGGTGSTTAPIPSTSAVGTTQYFVSQNSTCGESPRATISVTVNTTPAAPSVTTPITYCQNATATALAATGSNLLWYATATAGTGSTTAPIPSTLVAGSILYYVSQTIGSCEGSRAAITVTVNATPSLPLATTPITYCRNATATALTATGSNLLWYNAPLGGAGSTIAPTPFTTTAGNTNFYVSQTMSGCEGPRALITVIVNATPAAPIVTSPIAFCQGATANALTATGTALVYYTTPTGGTGSTIAPTPSTSTVGSTSYHVSQTINGCEGPRAIITVNILPTPAAPTAASPIAYCQGSTATALTATGTNLLWYNTASAGASSTTATIPSTATAGAITYYVSQTTGTCEGPRAAIIVNVSAAPSITTQPQDITSCTTTATFSVVATGSNLTYQWFVSTDAGATYSPIAAATASTVVINNLTAASANYKYRVVVSSGTCTAATSLSVTARVGVNPVVVLTAAPSVNFNPYTNGGLYVAVTPTSNYAYVWKRNAATISNITTSLTKANGLLDGFGSYVVTATDAATGCTANSNTLLVNDVDASIKDRLFVTPNPTSGIVKVSYYSSTTNPDAKYITIYDSKGARILVKQLSFVGIYGSVEIDITRVQSDTYIFVMSNSEGKKIASEKVIKH